MFFDQKRFWLLVMMGCAMGNSHVAHANESNEVLWTAWFNTTPIAGKWGFISDVQIRSSDDADNIRNILLRPGVTYALDKDNILAGGYAYIGTYNNGNNPDVVEHRPWIQYVANRKLAGYSVANRFRLEHRFIERPVGDDVQSDRFRYFARSILPLAGTSAPFNHGAFVALQNEVFLHLSNKDDLNGKTFDQNRAYVAMGWRISPKTDIEIGYMNQYLKGRATNTQNHILQFAIYTR